MKLENEKLYVKHQSGEGATLGSAAVAAAAAAAATAAAAALELKRKLLENSCLENFIQHKEKLEEEGEKKADLALALEAPSKE